MPQVPFAFEFESEWPNGNLATVLSVNCDSAIQTQNSNGTSGTSKTHGVFGDIDADAENGYRAKSLRLHFISIASINLENTKEDVVAKCE